jgi:amino acid adenylation domain-containing protein
MPAGTFVALYMDRSIGMIGSMLAIFKAGGAYVPISPDYPNERLSYIMEDIKVGFVISQAKYGERLSNSCEDLTLQPAFIYVDNSNDYQSNSVKNLDRISDETDLAYMIYTSGTTGNPKGVMVEHKSAVNTISAMKEVYDFTGAHRKTSCFSEYVFDVSVSEIFNSLCFGGELHLLSQDVRKNAHALSDYVLKNELDYLFVAPALLAVMPKIEFPSLQKIIYAGEPCDSLTGEYWGSKYELYNYYGPTEATIYATGTRVDPKNIGLIGKPIANSKAYVLNDDLQPVPVGSVGELYIGGASLARGYYNLPELTEQQFITNVFASQKDKDNGNTRIYKTGDLVRWMPDGNLEYLGRVDNQIKLRGYRIELGEIENVLTHLNEIKQAVVVDINQGENKYLAAYFVTNDEASISVEAIRRQLGETLPDYMIPSVFTELEEIPLSINGKLDRRALPHPFISEEEDYVAPTNELEENLVEIWKEVLNVDKVGINDNFFRLGGNSILAVRLTALSRKRIGFDISLAILFEHKTIAGIANQVANTELVVIPTYDTVQAPLSFAQERLFFIEQFEQGSTAYHMPYFVKLTPDVDVESLNKAFNLVIDRHTILKTVYKTDEAGNNFQTVLNESVTIEQNEVTEENLMNAVSERVKTPFDLSDEVSLRLNQYSTEKGEYLLVLWHHIAFDGWSVGVFMQELGQAYTAVCADEKTGFTDLEISYADYSEWQREYLSGDKLLELENYWQGHLSGFETLKLPTDFVRPLTPDYRGQNFDFTLNNTLSQKLRNLAKEKETTLYTVLLSGFYVTMATLSGQEDIVIGTPSANRHHPQTQSLIGFFVNSLALRTQVNPNQNIETFIDEVHELVSRGKIHQDLPFESIVSSLKIERDQSRHPIYQVMFDVQTVVATQEQKSVLPFEAIVAEGADTLYTPAKFDLDLSIIDDGTHIHGIINYALSLFNEDAISRMAQIFERVLESFVADQKVQLKDINMVSVEDRFKLLETWNDYTEDYPSDKTIHEEFEVQAQKTPDNVALVFEEESISYKTLNEEANKLARVIARAFGASNRNNDDGDQFVALYMDKSLEMVISIMAVLKAGYAYVPISIENPKERTKFILEDTDAFLAIAEDRYLEELEALESDSAQIRSYHNLMTDEAAAVHVESNVNSENLAYVIYTSGTTGLPKGVMTEHKSVMNLISNEIRKFDFTSDESVIWLSSYVFDASVEQLFLALLSGSKLIIPSSETIKDTIAIKDLILRQEVTHIDATPSYLLALGAIELPNAIRRVVAGGEAFTANLVGLWNDKLINEYGPTETTVTSLQNIDYSENNQLNTIGVPVANTKVYVLSDNLELVPIGIPGELHVSGAGLARGYLNRPELTSEKFIENKFATEDEKEKGYDRMYNTGDLVRWLPNGNVEFLGRKDEQVKIRGYRIELGEIENRLNGHSKVDHSVITVFERAGENYIAAYFVSKEGESVTKTEVLNYLEEALPKYMLPTSIIQLENIPLTVTGKLDKRALPSPKSLSDSKYVAPRTELEKNLAAIWNELLEVEQLGIEDNYFLIGGNSINASKLVMRTNKALITKMSIADLFTYPTIETLATFLESAPMEGEIIKSLTPNSKAKQNLFMIHPGRVGVEAYQPLVEELDENFNCIGIDNYNIISSNKIDGLNTLSNYYLECIEERFDLEEPVVLFGWSLGGQVALEMASILEKRGRKNIEVYLVDTILNFDAAVQESDKMDEVYQSEYLKQGFDQAYIDNTLKAFKAEDRLSLDAPSGKLNHTQITLFKAGIVLNSEGEIVENDSILQSTEMIVDTISEFTSNEVSTILFENRHHWNILEEKQKIKSEIVNRNKQLQ